MTICAVLDLKYSSKISTFGIFFRKHLEDGTKRWEIHTIKSFINTSRYSFTEICPAGTYGSSRGLHGAGRLGVRPCLWCPVGWYQSQVGALACVRCDANMTTTHRRSVRPQDCYTDPSPCSTQLYSCSNGGTCLAQGIHSICICTSGYFGKWLYLVLKFVFFSETFW